MDLTALFSMTYGMYVVSAATADHRAACLINTGTQVTATPPRLIISVHKDNFTSGVIADAGAFALTVLDQTTDMPFIGPFGFRTSEDFDKFAGHEVGASVVGAPYVLEHACAVVACRVVRTVDAGTHRVFLSDIADARRLSDKIPLTYARYHAVLKGKTPSRAASYQA